MSIIGIIRDEITADPLIRGYSGMSNLEVAEDGHIFYRPLPTITAETFMNYLMFNTYKWDTGTDTPDRSIYQRMKEVNALTIPLSGTVPDPWGSGQAEITRIRLIKTQQLFDFFTLSFQGNLSIDLTGTNFGVYLTGSQQAGCMSTVQKDEILALANNLQTRWMELGAGNVREGTIARARA